MIPHGESRYKNYGCSCPICKSEHKYKVREKRKERTEKLRKDPSLAPHGRPSTYYNWGCRCIPCTKAHSAEQRKYR